MTEKTDFDGAFKGLRQLLKARSASLVVKVDTWDSYYLETREPLWKGKRFAVAAVKKNKNYVSFHLVPVYLYPDLLRGLSPALRKRMQGKGCFNFTAPDRDLFDELSALVQSGFSAIKKRGLPA